MGLPTWRSWSSIGAKSSEGLVHSGRDRQLADFLEQYEQPSLPILRRKPQPAFAGSDVVPKQQRLGRFDPGGKLNQNPPVL